MQKKRYDNKILKCNSIQFNSIQFNSIQFNSIQFNSIQFNSIQFNSIQFNSIQFNSVSPMTQICAGMMVWSYYQYASPDKTLHTESDTGIPTNSLALHQKCAIDLLNSP